MTHDSKNHQLSHSTQHSPNSILHDVHSHIYDCKNQTTISQITAGNSKATRPKYCSKLWFYLSQSAFGGLMLVWAAQGISMN